MASNQDLVNLRRARQTMLEMQKKIGDRDLKNALDEAINVIDSALWGDDKRIREAFVKAANA